MHPSSRQQNRKRWGLCVLLRSPQGIGTSGRRTRPSGGREAVGARNREPELLKQTEMGERSAARWARVGGTEGSEGG